MSIIPEVSHFNIAGQRELHLMWQPSQIHLRVSAGKRTLFPTFQQRSTKLEYWLDCSVERQEHSVSGKLTVSSPERLSRWAEAVIHEDVAVYIRKLRSERSSESQEKRD